MAFKNTTNATLTDTQAQLTSKIGSIKSLLSIPLIKKRNIPKNQQISTFDYLVRILQALGVNPEIVFQFFISKVFDTTNTFLEDVVIRGVASSLDAKNIKLSQDKTNEQVLKDVIPANFLVTAKLLIAKELTLMVFGPRDGRAAETLVSNPVRRSQLLGEAVCGYNMFTLSNNPSIRNEDVEFNRIKLKEQLEKGEVIFEINCQDVKIKLPDDPGFIFGAGGGAGTIPGKSVTPAQSLNLLVQYVSDRGQSINNQQNAKKIGRSFFEILLEKLLSYITTLIIPYVGPIFSFLKTRPETSGLTPENTLYGSCAVNNNPTPETKAFSSSIMNDLLKELLKTLLIFAMDEFKKLVESYFKRTAFEKVKRNIEKIKMKFKIFDNIPDLSKLEKISKALEALDNILK